VKLTALEKLPEVLKGKRVVLANGCFDVLHVGHVRYLEAAKRLGDVLVVAINGDESVKGLKGPGRPILNQAERVALVSGLKCVDHVVVFNEQDVSRVIDVLKPSVHAKGSDYTEATVPERNQVLAYGGEVRIAGDPKDHSTRDVIQKIINTYGSNTK
jgi:D-glycero-beta-D-manno-heptose 1-phosphate adenylyltransferase